MQTERAPPSGHGLVTQATLPTPSRMDHAGRPRQPAAAMTGLACSCPIRPSCMARGVPTRSASTLSNPPQGLPRHLCARGQGLAAGAVHDHALHLLARRLPRAHDLRADQHRGVPLHGACDAETPPVASLLLPPSSMLILPACSFCLSTFFNYFSVCASACQHSTACLNPH